MTWQQQLVLIAPILLISLVAHEYAHAWVAERQGDSTARDLGRITWNPIKHIDPFMTIILPLMLASVGAPILAGAKPVPVNPSLFRDRKKGDILVSLAGVAANFIIVLLCFVAILLAGLLGATLPFAADTLALFQRMAIMGIFINMVLIAFNLLPIPPLDGSHVFKYLLPPALARRYESIAGYGILILMALLYFVPGIRSLIVGPALFVQSVAELVYLPLLLPSPSL